MTPSDSDQAGFDQAGIEDGIDAFPIHPYQATKRYTCPWCHGAIEPGTGHIVVVPRQTPEDRRHWHKGCWHKSRRGAIPG